MPKYIAPSVIENHGYFPFAHPKPQQPNVKNFGA